jgi:hypothetical protein
VIRERFSLSRQPYLPAFAKCGYSIGAGAINVRPEFVAAIGRCVAFWSFVEHQLAVLLGVVLKAENEAAIAVFAKLRRSSNQKETVEVAARIALDQQTQRLLSAILAVYRSVEAQQNDIVHGCWGVIGDRADLATWVAAEHHSVWNTKVLTSEDKGIHVGHEDLRGRLFVYTLKDLDEIFLSMSELWTILFDFVGYVRGSVAPGMYKLTGAELFGHLSNLPRIKEALAHLDRRRNND